MFSNRGPRYHPIRVLHAALVAFAVATATASAAGAAPASACRADVYGGAAYTVCSFDLAATDVRVFWQKPDGTPFRTFGALASSLAAAKLAVSFAINGGMFTPEFTPVGLFVENGQVLHPLNTAGVRAGILPVPNFFKKPNGVFFVSGRTAGIVTTDAFAKAHPKADFATQSGPMLVIDGNLHPALIAGSADRTRRSGVGIIDARHVVFVISEGAVNFYDFATFFRDRLGAANALFLDGGHAPGIFSPELGRDDRSLEGGYGPIIAVVRPAA